MIQFYLWLSNVKNYAKANFCDVKWCDTCKSENKKVTHVTWVKHNMTLVKYEWLWKLHIQEGIYNENDTY